MGREGKVGVGGLRAYVMDGGCGAGGAFLVLSDPEHVYTAMHKIMHKHFESTLSGRRTVLTDRSTLCYASRELGD